MSATGPAPRAVVRWAWRMFKREWRQQVLVLTLLTLAVAVSVAGATMITNASASSQPEFGAANARTQLDAKTPAAAQAAESFAQRRFGQIEVIGHTEVAIPGSSQRLDLRAQNPKGVFSHVMVALRKGRYPTAAGEIALTNGAAKELSVTVGDRVALDRVTRTVVGLVENPTDLDDEFALAPASELNGTGGRTLLFNNRRISGPDVADSGPRVDLPISIRGNNGPVAVIVLMGTTVAMALVGLIAAAGFIVVAQRRQRQLGLLAAIGATERHLRLVVTANGAIVGVVASVVGGALGLLGWLAAAPAVEAAAAHRIDRFDVPWGLVGSCLAVAFVMATAAAWWPARKMSRMPIMSALSGRPSRPAPVHRSLVVALVVLVGGGVAVANAYPKGQDPRPVLIIGGIIAILFGIVFAAPGAIRVVAAPAGRLPLMVRLALRDLARYQARAAAALAAITLGLGIAVAVIGASATSVHKANEGNLSSKQLLVQFQEPRVVADDANRAALEQERDANAARVAAVVPGSTVYSLDYAIGSVSDDDASQHEPVSLGKIRSAHSIEGLGPPYVATPELLAHFGIDPATIKPTTELLTGRTDPVVLVDFTSRDRKFPTTKIQRVDIPTGFEHAPSSLITQHAMETKGWHTVQAGWFIEAPRAITSEQIKAARSVAASAGLTVETRDSQDDLAAIRTIATAVGALLALAIVAMTIGLIRGESARDMRTLTATGASGLARRTLTATTAGALAFLGVILGSTGAYIPLIASYHDKLSRLVPLPWVPLLTLGIGMPLVAAAGGWLLAGREPQHFSRQAFE